MASKPELLGVEGAAGVVDVGVVGTGVGAGGGVGVGAGATGAAVA